MFQEFREDLGPTTLRVLYGFALTSVLTALGVGVALPLARGKSISLLWILVGAGLAIAVIGVGLGAWLQSRRAPARMYRYSRDLSPLARMLFEQPVTDNRINETLLELRGIIDRESGHRVVAMVYSVSSDGSAPTLTHFTPGGDQHATLTPDSEVAALATKDAVLREDNLPKRVSKKPDADLSAFHQAGLKSLRAAPIKLDKSTVGILVVGDDHRRWLGAGEDRLILLVKTMLSGIWPHPEHT